MCARERVCVCVCVCVRISSNVFFFIYIIWLSLGIEHMTLVFHLMLLYWARSDWTGVCVQISFYFGVICSSGACPSRRTVS